MAGVHVRAGQPYSGCASPSPPRPRLSSLPRASRWTLGVAMRVPVGRDAGAREYQGHQGDDQRPAPLCWPRSSIRNAHSIHQRSRKRLSQDTYRRNSVRFMQQRRRHARPEPQSAGGGLSECRTGPGTGRGREGGRRRGLSSGCAVCPQRSSRRPRIPSRSRQCPRGPAQTSSCTAAARAPSGSWHLLCEPRAQTQMAPWLLRISHPLPV